MGKKYNATIDEEQQQLRDENASKIEREEETLRQQTEEKIDNAQHEAEKGSNLLELRDAAEEAANRLRDEEEQLEKAKKKLEDLTGKPVKDQEKAPRTRGKADEQPYDDYDYDYDDMDYSDYDDGDC